MNLVRVLALAVLTGTLLTGTSSIVWVYVIAFVLGLSETFVDTSLAALVPQAVRHGENLGRANARIEVAQNVTNQFIGPPLAGVLAIAGLAWVTGVSALLFAATVPILAAMGGGYRPTPETSVGGAPAGPVPKRQLRREVLAGVRFIWASRLLRGLTLITAAMNVFWAAWAAVLVVYAVAPGPVGLTPAGYGVLLASMAIGGIAGASAVTPLRRRVGPHTLLALDVVGTILLVGTPALTTNPFAIGAAMFVGGAGSAVWRVIVAVVRQSVTPAGLLGRVYSASRVISWGVLPLGAALGAAVAELAGVRAVFVVGGIASLTLLVAFVLAVRPNELAAALVGEPAAEAVS